MQTIGSPSVHGYLGATSFASTFYDGSSPLRSEQTHSRLSTRITEADVRKGQTCLWLLKDLPQYRPLVERWAEDVTLSVIAPWTIAIQSSLQTDIVDYLNQSQDADADYFLYNVSAKLWSTSCGPMDLDGHCSFDQFAQRMTGANLRWEAVGMYFTAVGLALEALEYMEGTKSARNSFQARRDLARNMLEASDQCITWCEKTGQLTDPETWLYMENYHLCSLIDGDASFPCWRRLGNAISIVVAVGLHGEIKPTNQVPFWLSELRKRLFGVIYISDKAMAHFLGRPPRLPRKFCTMQLPLDLGPEHLRLPSPELEKVVENLDPNGWNLSDKLSPNIFVRTGIICHMINEDILELMMSSLPPYDSEKLARGLLERCHESWESLPQTVRNSYIQDVHNRTYVGSYADVLDMANLDFRLNEFLLHRLLIRRHGDSNDELIRISKFMLSRILTLIRQHRSTPFTHDIPWIVSKYALPAAGILCIELLRQIQGQRTSALLNRSEVIQNLSSLIATLKWIVTKKTVNHEICEQARDVIQKVLHTVLEAPFMPRAELSDSRSGQDLDHSTDLDNFAQPHEARSDAEFWNSEFWVQLHHHPLLAEST